MSDGINMLDLPDDMLENILSCLSYDEIAKNRLVSKWYFLVVHIYALMHI